MMLREKVPQALELVVSTAYNQFAHVVGSLTLRYYFEDYVRVYPDGSSYTVLGVRRLAGRNQINNLLNHAKFYHFAAQFVQGKVVADLGCGSGYGCKILKDVGKARKVYGCDLSEHALKYARSHFGSSAEFTKQSITNLGDYQSDSFEVGVTSEVLEHVKEYGMEQLALSQVKRVVRDRGLIIVATPNSELLARHGFGYDEIQRLFQKNFKKYCVFENALIPFDQVKKALWKNRLSEGHTGVVVSENINLSETVLPPDVMPELKKGIKPGLFHFDEYQVDLTLLHNTHSWIALAINEK